MSFQQRITRRHRPPCYLESIPRRNVKLHGVRTAPSLRSDAFNFRMIDERSTPFRRAENDGLEICRDPGCVWRSTDDEFVGGLCLRRFEFVARREEKWMSFETSMYILLLYLELDRVYLLSFRIEFSELRKFRWRRCIVLSTSWVDLGCLCKFTFFENKHHFKATWY